jgi:uncharacterized membrane protein
MDIDTAQLIALAGVLGFASGLRLYAVLLVVGAAGYAGWVDLPEGLRPLSHPWVIAAASFMVLVEFLADKVPAIDSLWDAVHTVIRIPAGAALAAAVFGFGQGDPVWATVAALLGGTLAATSHLTKTGARAAVNTSPEPVTNVAVSTAEDVFVGGLLWLALAHPFVAFGLVLAATGVAVWLLPRLLRFVMRALRRLLNTAPAQPSAAKRGE